MRVQITASLVSAFLLSLVTVASSGASLGYISTVEIEVDGFVCATCVRAIEGTLEQENGVAEVSGDWESGIIGVTVDQNVGWVDLFDISQRINSMRNYTVIGMKIAAVGRVAKYPVEYYTGELYAYTGDRYRLQIRDTRKSHFLLANNEKLKELVDSGQEAVRVMGVVTAFSENVPILKVTEFEKLDGSDGAEIAKGLTVTGEETPDHIVWMKLYMDGFICASCVRILENNLLTEEGVGSVNANRETGIVTITPVLDGEQLDPFYLRRRVNALRDSSSDYTIRRIDVEAVGAVVKFPVRYFRAKEYTHNHDRYKLQVGDNYFVLAENRKLQELIGSKLKRARVKGTITATSEGKSILTISDFKTPGGELAISEQDDPLDMLAASLVGEIEIPENIHAHIDSVRIYVDGFICAACATPLKDATLQEEGVKSVITDADAGVIELVSEDGATLDLYDIEQRINALREYEVLKMDVVASGKIKKVEVAYAENTLNAEKSSRYALSAGASGSFILSENDKLEEILKSGDEAITAVGTVTAFWGHTPILYVKNYVKLEKYPEWLK